jgi:short-subunit dehydrogenase
MRLSGARVLLTGATGGLGEAIARVLARRGASLVLTGRRADVLQSLAAELGAEVIPADLAQRSEVDQLIAAAGVVDILVANAALPASGAVLDFDSHQIDRALEVNLRAPIVLARALGAGMVERGRGHVVLVSSLSGLTASPGTALYSATKFGLRGFAHGFRQDLHGTGVGVSVVLPGFIRDAGMFAESGASLPAGVRTRAPRDVAMGVLRAIEHDRAEVIVAPPELRVGSLIGSVAPGLSATMQRLVGADKLNSTMAAGNRSKR